TCPPMSWSANRRSTCGSTAEPTSPSSLPQDCLTKRSKSLGGRTCRYGSARKKLARRLSALGQLFGVEIQASEAEAFMRRALAIDEKNFGSEDATVARDLNNLAQLLQDMNRPAEAEPLARRTLTISEFRFGAKNPMVAIALNNLARLLHSTHRLT